MVKVDQEDRALETEDPLLAERVSHPTVTNPVPPTVGRSGPHTPQRVDHHLAVKIDRHLAVTVDLVVRAGPRMVRRDVLLLEMIDHRTIGEVGKGTKEKLGHRMGRTVEMPQTREECHRLMTGVHHRMMIGEGGLAGTDLRQVTVITIGESLGPTRGEREGIMVREGGTGTLLKVADLMNMIDIVIDLLTILKTILIPLMFKTF